MLVIEHVDDDEFEVAGSEVPPEQNKGLNAELPHLVELILKSMQKHALDVGNRFGQLLFLNHQRNGFFEDNLPLSVHSIQVLT